MSATPEGRIKDRITRYAQSQGCAVIRLYFARGVTVGWPDTLLILPQGITLFVEVKRKGQQPSEIQKHRLSVLHELGHKAIWCDNFDAARGAILSAMGTAALHGAGGTAPNQQPHSGPAAPTRRP
jgi:VRR-NUC domain